MARTKATVGAKVHSVKSSKARCSVAPAATSGMSSGSSDKTPRLAGGGNPVCPRETPKWQKPITTFFINQPAEKQSDKDGKAAGSSKVKPKRNIIESSDEETSPGKPKNKELDDTIELEDLTGENSHKIEEYYPKGSKGKGVGKKTKKRNSKTKGGETEENGGNENGDRNGNSSENESKKETEGIIEQKETVINKANEEEKESTSETEDITEENDKVNKSDISKENSEKNENFSKTKGKENVNSNIKKRKSEKEDRSEENDSNIKDRIKRVREDKLNEGNVSKKIKV